MSSDTVIEMVIGIDPGVKTGIAWMRVRPMEIERVETVTFWRAHEMLKEIAETDSMAIDRVAVVIENGGAVSHVYHNAANKRAQNSTAKRVGGNNRESDLLAAGIERLGFTVFRPIPRHTKKTAEYVRRLTGFTGRTNDHNRDAITMIWGGQWHLKWHLKENRVVSPPRAPGDQEQRESC